MATYLGILTIVVGVDVGVDEIRLPGNRRVGLYTVQFPNNIRTPVTSECADARGIKIYQVLPSSGRRGVSRDRSREFNENVTLADYRPIRDFLFFINAPLWFELRTTPISQ